MSGAFDAVLFDFGGVIVSSPFDLLRTAGAGEDVDPEAVLELLMGDYAVDDDHPWHRLERGEMDLAEYGRDLLVRAEAAGIDLDFSAMRSFYGELVVHDTMVDAVRRLRADGFRLGLVTNNVREFGDTWRAMVPVDELFEVVVDSSEVGMRKPNPAIYHHTLRELGGVAPERAVFLDDAPGNVDGARRAGLAAILVDDPDIALAELWALLDGGPDSGGT